MSSVICPIEAEKLNKMSSLLERLHAKFNQNRPWTETVKLVRQVMVRVFERLVILHSLFMIHTLLAPGSQLSECTLRSIKPQEEGSY